MCVDSENKKIVGKTLLWFVLVCTVSYAPLCLGPFLERPGSPFQSCICSSKGVVPLLNKMDQIAVTFWRQFQTTLSLFTYLFISGEKAVLHLVHRLPTGEEEERLVQDPTVASLLCAIYQITNKNDKNAKWVLFVVSCSICCSIFFATVFLYSSFWRFCFPFVLRVITFFFTKISGAHNFSCSSGHVIIL